MRKVPFLSTFEAVGPVQFTSFEIQTKGEKSGEEWKLSEPWFEGLLSSIGHGGLETVLTFEVISWHVWKEKKISTRAHKNELKIPMRK